MGGENVPNDLIAIVSRLDENDSRLVENKQFLNQLFQSLPLTFAEGIVVARASDIVHIYHRETQLPEIMEEVRSAYIAELSRLDGSVAGFAEHYGVQRTNVYRTLRKLNISKKDYKPKRAA